MNEHKLWNKIKLRSMFGGIVGIALKSRRNYKYLQLNNNSTKGPIHIHVYCNVQLVHASHRKDQSEIDIERSFNNYIMTTPVITLKIKLILYNSFDALKMKCRPDIY